MLWLKMFACAAVVTAFSSFVEADPCKPTDDQVRAGCEYSSTQTCQAYYDAGPCEGKTYDYPNNRAK